MFVAVAVVLLGALPVGVVVWLPAEHGSIVFLEAVVGVAVLILVARLATGRSAEQWRCELHWVGKAMVRYLACCFVPPALVFVVLGLSLPGGRGRDGFARADFATYVWPLSIVACLVTFPTLVLLLAVAPRAGRGGGVGAVVALVPSALPLLVGLMFGSWPAVLLVVLQVLYACFLMPGCLDWMHERPLDD
ncbi:hypothetical protein OG618_01205 [Kitasatospora sp. NBC_01246]|uniref:hypothetical protein n=1 Tax=Kitasatospora sp. NBC_01246 TaxID=2903570 RepID=UPI002E366C67|nr:hypothetical protein [Kitasatospora sp. NBC_01246]